MTERIRVLHALTSLGGYGGIQDYVASLAIMMDSRRFEVEIASGPGEGVHVERVRAAGIPIHHVRFVRAVSPWTDMRGLRDIYRLLRQRRYDIVHVHMSKGAFLTRLAARAVGVPLVVFAGHNFGVIYFHGTLLAPLFWLIDKALLGLCTDLVISEANYMTREIIRLRIVAPTKVVTILSGIDVARLQAYAGVEPAEVSLLADGPKVGTVARLAPEKGLLTLVAAAPRVIAAVPSVQFVIVGDGPQRAELEVAVRNAGLQDRFAFLGALKDAGALLKRFDIFVLPSRSEGMPIALMEAMAVGCAPVASAVGGVGELVTHGESGLLVPAGDPEALAQALIDALSDDDCRRRLGAAARDVIYSRFTLDKMVRDIETVYSDRLRTLG